MMPNSYHKSSFLRGKLDEGLEKWKPANARIWYGRSTTLPDDIFPLSETFCLILCENRQLSMAVNA